METSWVYGIRTDDIKKIFKVIYDKRGNMEIVYLIGKIVVIYKPKSKTQRHYRQHKYPVISFDTNENKRIIASG